MSNSYNCNTTKDYDRYERGYKYDEEDKYEKEDKCKSYDHDYSKKDWCYPPKCECCIPGPQGPCGKPGPQGPCGPSPIKAYGSFFSNLDQTIVAPNDIPFVGFTENLNTSLNTGSLSINVEIAGVYLINASVRGIPAAGTTFAIAVGGTAITQTTTAFTLPGERSLTTTYKLEAGDDVSIRVLTGSINLDPPINTMLTILRIS